MNPYALVRTRSSMRNSGMRRNSSLLWMNNLILTLHEWLRCLVCRGEATEAAIVIGTFIRLIKNPQIRPGFPHSLIASADTLL